MNGQGPENVKEMCCVIKWMLDHPNVGWKCQPQGEFDDHGSISSKMSGMSGATCGLNKQDSGSVTGCLSCLMGVLTAWRSKAQTLCALSSSESEYIAIRESVKEALFAKQIVEDIGHKVEGTDSCALSQSGGDQHG